MLEQELKKVIEHCNLLIDSKPDNLDKTFTESLLEILHAAIVLRDLMTNIPDEPNKFNQYLIGLDNEKIGHLVHDIRTPLNAIIGFSNLIGVSECAGALTETQHQYLQVVYDISQQLHKWLTEMFHITSITSGPHPLAYPEFSDIAEVLKEVVRQISNSPRYAEKFSTINLTILPDLPQVYADSVRVKQTIFNIIATIKDFTENGILTIKAEPLPDHQYIKLSVVDTGSGIDPKLYACMLHNWDDVDDSPILTLRDEALRERRKNANFTQQTDLTIAQLIVHIQGGKFWFESEVGVKSAFYFTIPTQPSQDK